MGQPADSSGRYTDEDLYKLAQLGIFPSKLGVFGKWDEEVAEIVDIDVEILICEN